MNRETKQGLDRARELLAKKLPWTKVSSPGYKNAAHEYIIRHRCRAAWDELAEIIRDHGEYRKWRTAKFKYLVHGEYIYWRMGVVINRSYVEALDNGGYPSKADQERIYERFWGGKE